MAQQIASSSLQYTKLPERAQKLLESENVTGGDQTVIDERKKKLGAIPKKTDDREGDVEVLDEYEFHHHFIHVPGDYETVKFHYVTAGMENPGELIVFLHGIPESWFQWYHQMAHFAKRSYRTIAIDLKGYGQSETSFGDYRHEGAAAQLYNVLIALGIDKAGFNLVTHDRGTVQGDYIAALHPESVLRYGRGEQHLFHYNPQLSPQGDLFANAPRNGIMDDPVQLLVMAYTTLAYRDIPDSELRRSI